MTRYTMERLLVHVLHALALHGLVIGVFQDPAAINKHRDDSLANINRAERLHIERCRQAAPDNRMDRVIGSH